MIVCVCRRVSDREIERQVREGCTTLDELQMETGLGTCCGRCTDCAVEVLQRCQQRAGTAASSQEQPVVLAWAA